MVHAVTIDGDLVHKRYESFARGEDEREYRALALLHRYAPGLAPEPVRRVVEPDYRELTMTRVAGTVLDAADLHGPIATAVAESLDRSHSAVPEFEVAELEWSLGSIEMMLPRVLQMRGDFPGDVEPAVDDWLDSDDCRGLRTNAVVFGRADHNLKNFLRAADGTIHLVDFEDSGKIDRAMDMAELTEHVSAIEVPESVWQRIIALSPLGPHDRHHLLQCRRLVAIFWLLLITDAPWSARQRARVLRLLSR